MHKFLNKCVSLLLAFAMMISMSVPYASYALTEQFEEVNRAVLAEQTYNATTVLDEGASVTLSPEGPYKKGDKVKINVDVDDDKEIQKIKVEKEQYLTLDLDEENTFTMPDHDVTITVLLKDKYTDDKWCLEDFTYKLFVVGDIFDEDSLAEFAVTGFSEQGLKKLETLKDVVLPRRTLKAETIEVVLEDAAFKGKNIRSLTVPDNYKKIYERAFKGCGIETLNLSEGLEYIFDETFADNNLTEFIAPKSFRYPSKGAFKNNKLKKVALNCTAIGEEAFMNNEITELDLGNQVTRLYKNAFKNNKLTEVNIPLTLKNGGYGSLPPIYASAFNENPGHPDYDKVILWTPKKNNPKKLRDQGNYIIDPKIKDPNAKNYLPEDFEYDGNLVVGFSDSGRTKLSDLGEDVAVELPDVDTEGNKITGVGYDAFDSEEFKKILMPEGYTSIDVMAFNAVPIEEFVAPLSLESVDSLAFMSCEVVIYAQSQEHADKIAENSSDYWSVVYDKSKLPEKPKPEVKKYFTFEVVDGLNTVTGFTEDGKERLKTNKDLELPTVDYDGNKVEAVGRNAFQGKFGKDSIDKLIIPEGYKKIGMMAFTFCGIDGELVLPSTIESLGLAAFFRNNITEVVIPEKVTEIPLSLFRGNKLSKLEFKGQVTKIERLSFGENMLTEITIPSSVTSIGEQAFESNKGSSKFGYKVVIRIEGGENPNSLPDKENYLINPTGEGTDPGIDASKWTTDDFRYDGTTVLGFSEKGILKVKENSELIVPDLTPDEKPVTAIGDDAFRNLSGNINLTSAVFPETVTYIGHYALQFNKIPKFKLPRDLKTLGMGVFMMVGLEDLTWNDKLENIGAACFYNSTLGDVVLPKALKVIDDAAFRDTGITSLKFGEGSELKEIKRLAFADNNISVLELPEGIEKISGDAAFANNQLTEVTIPDSLKDLGFETFIGNPSVVVIHTKDKNNINNLANDTNGTYVIDPDVKANEEDKKILKEEIDKANPENISDSFKNFFNRTLKEAQEDYNNPEISATTIKKDIWDMKFINSRTKLARLMFEKENLGITNEKLNEVYNEANESIMVYNLSVLRLAKLENDLEINIRRTINEDNPLEGATSYDGQSRVEVQLRIEDPYDVKVRIWVKDGSIVYAEDNGTICDAPGEHHNRGYWIDAKSIIHNYNNKTLKEVNDSTDFDIISGATVSCREIDNAIKKAVKTALLNDVKKAYDEAVAKAEELKIDITSDKVGENPTVADYEASTAKINEKIAKAKDVSKPKRRHTSSSSSSSASVVSTKPKAIRISGSDRISTSIELSKKMHKHNSDNIILANKDKYADVLTASPLASQMKAPILFIDENKIDSKVLSEIARLKAKNIYLIGGEASISDKVKDQLSGKNIERIAGKDRYETSLKIALKLREKGNKSIVNIANGEAFADALTISSLAARDNAPIILYNKDVLGNISTKVKTVNIAGMYNSISKEVEDSLKNQGIKVNRYGGADRYETAVKMMEALNSSSNSGVYVSGTVFADGLLAGPYAATIKAPVLLVTKDKLPISVAKASKEIKEFSIVGGENTISRKVFKELETLVK